MNEEDSLTLRITTALLLTLASIIAAAALWRYVGTYWSFGAPVCVLVLELAITRDLARARAVTCVVLLVQVAVMGLLLGGAS